MYQFEQFIFSAIQCRVALCLYILTFTILCYPAWIGLSFETVKFMLDIPLGVLMLLIWYKKTNNQHKLADVLARRSKDWKLWLEYSIIDICNDSHFCVWLKFCQFSKIVMFYCVDNICLTVLDLLVLLFEYVWFSSIVYLT